MNKEITLAKKGRLIVVTDLHGNYNDYNKYLNLWDKDDENSHIVFVGDLIHNPTGLDQSVEILDDAMEKTRKYPNFHVLLGNHEWAHIIRRYIFKADTNLIFDFEKLVERKKGSLQPAMDNYVDFFKKLPYFLKSDNGLFISHAGPSKNMKNMDDYEKIFDDDYNNPLLYEFLWNRPYYNYTPEDVENFLDIVEKNCMIVGHTNVHGYKTVGKQIIITSSHQTNNKVYFDIDLEQDINDMYDMLDYLKYLY